MKVLVCGGRDFKDFESVNEELTWLAGEHSLEIIHGGAKGADSLAGEWARLTSTPCKVFKADWAKYGRAEGPIRNKQMLIEGKPDLVIAFPGGKGTANMVKQAREAGIEVKEVR